jgi:lysophospholipase L1-like esterase
MRSLHLQSNWSCRAPQANDLGVWHTGVGGTLRRLKIIPAIALVLSAGLLQGIGGTTGHATSAGAATAPHWVASWAASPTDDSWPTDPTLTLVPLVLSFQTIRDVITPHLGGSELRIHLSNRFDSSPTTFGHVTIGIQSSGAGATGIKTVTFGGSTSVTVPAGADVVSDPVALTFAAFTPLDVSIYVPSLLQGSITKHWAANATTYYSGLLSGDQSLKTSGSSFVGSTVSWLYVDGLDVEAPASTCSVATFGDSITDGFVSGSILSLPESTVQVNVNGRYPDDLQRRLNSAGTPISIVNAGISANELVSSTLSAFTGPSGLSRFETDALGQPGVCGVLVLEGINDLGFGGATAATLEAGYTQLISEAHAAGVKVWLGTILPASNSVTDGVFLAPSSDTYRQQTNAWIRTQMLADGYVDFDAVMRDPANPSVLNPAYASVDNLHPNLAGYQAMANAVPLSLIDSALPG